MDRRIVCFQIPTFQVALARLADPLLRHRPVAIAPSPTPRSLIAEASSEAQRDGILPGMTVGQARRVCPALALLPPHPDRAREADHVLFQIVSRFAPVWEPVQPGHLFLDLTGTTRLFGLACDTAARIEREVVQRSRLAGVTGVGSSKLVSRIAATLITPPQLCDVRPGSEEAFLAPLPVDTLPLGSFPAQTVLALLDDLNLQTLGDVAEIPLAQLEPVLGRHAGLVHAWAHGIDSSPVLPPAKQPRVEASLTLDPDEIDSNRLCGLLYGLLEYVCHDLRRQQRVGHCLTLYLQYRDAVEIFRSQHVTPGTWWEAELAPYLSILFARCFRRRVRLRVLTVGVEGLAQPDGQLNLFDQHADGDPVPASAPSTRARRLALAIDRIRTRFGSQAIWRGKTHAAIRPSPRSL